MFGTTNVQFWLLSTPVMAWSNLMRVLNCWWFFENPTTDIRYIKMKRVYLFYSAKK